MFIYKCYSILVSFFFRFCNNDSLNFVIIDDEDLQYNLISISTYKIIAMYQFLLNDLLKDIRARYYLNQRKLSADMINIVSISMI